VKLSFKEQKELQQLEQEIALMEHKKKMLLEKMNSGLSHEEMVKCSKDFEQVEVQLDEKSLRWLELQELQGG
jgi:ATP-binding cassette subfamily F protein uup